ncbi:hypothetical protein B0H15DRAFT_843096 [Mycena belliarum]|uniref:Uncharacterized protein n=1 Tax=Mycena belliarum TaxID=1033014 RepID=A0AAD6U1P8_9AGAR|nr:hypothetical protein B0H15DRAFT_843096 [Mycena belliae]
MGFFSTSKTSHTSARRGHRSIFHRVDKDRRAGGLKASLANPNTTSRGRKNAKSELHAMGRSAHVPFMTKVRRSLGMRSTPRRKRV